MGALVVGISPRRTFDIRYRDFLDLVANQIATAIGGAKAREAERQSTEALAALDRAKTAFFSNVSHEFRTPLTLILGPTEDALSSPQQALTGAALLAVYRNEHRLLKLVNSLLDFARIEAGRAQASYRETEVCLLTQDLASAFRSVIEHAGLRFQVECEHIVGPTYVDRETWEKIVLNLLSSAFKFTFEGEIRVALRESESAVELTVSDTGTGISESELPHIFQRFHRVQGARSRSYEGTGIGLALMYELVRMHGGTVAVQSRVGDGTMFTVRVPTGRAHLPPERVDANPTAELAATRAPAFVEEARRWLPDGPRERGAARAATDAAAESLAPGDPNVHVLVADDNADMRDYLRRLLRGRWTVTPSGTVPRHGRRSAAICQPSVSSTP